MNEQKLLTKLKRKAIHFEKTEIAEAKIIDVEEISDFYKWSGKLYFIEDKGYFLKDTKQGWMRFREIKKMPETEQLPPTPIPKELPEMPTPNTSSADLGKIMEKIKELDHAQIEFGKWANNLKKYVDTNFAQLFKSIDLILKILERDEHHEIKKT